MLIHLYYTALPSQQALNALDKKLSHIAKSQETIDGGKRLWITHVPETVSRPLLHPLPFDLLVFPLSLPSTLLEEYKISLGTAPKRCLLCRSADDSLPAFDILLALAREISTTTGAFLSIDDQLGYRMLGPDPLDDSFNINALHSFPGRVCEIVHETNDGDLNVEWFVDAPWLCAWLHHHYAPLNASRPSSASRFASLDYS